MICAKGKCGKEAMTGSNYCWTHRPWAAAPPVRHLQTMNLSWLVGYIERLERRRDKLDDDIQQLTRIREDCYAVYRDQLREHTAANRRKRS